MKLAPIPADDANRLAALRALRVLDTDPDPALDEITRAASDYFGTPIALVSLVDSDRQWFKSRVGLEATETSRDVSFCGHAIMGDDTFVVGDSGLDVRFADNPLALGAPHVRFYAGQPLNGPGNFKMGTLCIIDDVPHELSDGDLRMLRVLGRAAESALSASWEREQRATSQDINDALQEFMDITTSGVITIDEIGTIEEFNSGAEAMFGYQRSDVLGQNVRILMPEPYQSAHDGYLSSYLETGQARVIGIGRRVEALRRDGSVFPISLNVSEVRSGGRRRFVGLIVDVSELTQAQADIELFFSLSLDLFCIANTEGRFLRLNPAFEDLLGYSVEELLAKPFLDFIVPADVEATMAEVGRLAEGAVTVGFENRYACKDGSLKNLAWSARADPASGRIYATARDVTVERRREADLARLAAIIDAAPDYIAVFDPQGNITHLNSAWRRLIGLADGEPCSRQIASLYPVEAAAELMYEAVPAAFEGGGWSGESVLVGADGRTLEVQQSVLAHGQDSKNQMQLSVIAHDVSAYKEVERVKNEFVSTVSHELRTPLTSIRGSLGLLEGGVMGTLPEKAAAMVKIANQNTDRLIRLINDILDLEKMQAGGVELNLRTEALPALVSEAVEGMHGMAEAAHVALKTEFAETEVMVEVDHDRMVQVATNLLSNAIKFSSPGTQVCVRVDGPDSDGFVEFAVIDRGPGIPADKLESVFHRFSQVDSASTRAKGGTGLGLAIVQDIVALHGGTIEVASEVGQGSTFSVRLPIAPQQLSAATSATPAPMAEVDSEDQHQLPQPATAARLLIVEDDDELGEVMVELLTRVGHQVQLVATVEDAQSAIATQVPDVILIEMRLIETHGPDLLPELQSNPALGRVSVLVVSGSADKPGLAPAPRALNWVRLPVTDDKLIRTINAALGGKDASTVLVVEDDDSTREILTVMIEKEGFHVVQAANGREAFDALNRRTPDLIILDVGMPVMDGYQFVETLNKMQVNDIPVLIHTGQDLSNDQRERLSSGLTTFLAKTRTSNAQFIEAIHNSVNRSRHLDGGQ